MASPGILLTQIWGLGIIATKTLGNDFSCSICLFCILLYSVPQTVRLIIFSFCWDLREISLLRSPRLVIILCLSFGNVSYAILSGTKRNSCRECPQSPHANKGPKRRDSVTQWLSVEMEIDGQEPGFPASFPTPRSSHLSQFPTVIFEGATRLNLRKQTSS